MSALANTARALALSHGFTFLASKDMRPWVREVPVVVITAHASVPPVRPTVTHVLRKPVELGVLLDAVREAIAA